MFVIAFLSQSKRLLILWLQSLSAVIMEFGPITSWQIDGEKVETVADFIFLGSKINVDSDYSYEIKRRSILGRKAMTDLGSVLKSREITLLTKIHIVEARLFQ